MSGSGDMEKRTLIALGGLLHDIGKFVQRAEKRKSKSRDFFGYAHAELSYDFTKSILDGFGGFSDDDKHLVLSASFHHKPDTKHPDTREEEFPVRALFRLADWYASVERSQFTDTESEEQFKRLKPVFEQVDIGKGPAKDEYIYRLTPLSLNVARDGYPFMFPQLRSEARDYVDNTNSELYEELYGTYKSIYEQFEKAFKLKTISSPGEALSFVYHLLYKYTWCVPASIYDREKYHSHYPDISLFDHSRVVSALASSLYNQQNIELLQAYKDSKREEFANKLKIVIFEGDISGIQNFIYDISNLKGVAKRLRGRSVFLSFLPELVGRFFLKELGYPWTNILYAGGGKFQAVIGYEEGIEERLSSLAKKVEESLIETFRGKLGFVVYSHTFPLSGLRDYSGVVKALMDEGVEAKKRKFSLTIENFDALANEEIKGSVKMCPSCRIELIPEGLSEENTCGVCEQFKSLGDAVVKSNYLIISKEPLKGVKGGFYLKKIGGVYLTDKVSQKADKEDVFLLNDPEKFEKDKHASGFRFLATVVPEDEEGVKSFEDMAEEIKEGDKKLAFVMADVDNLGLIFMKGLGESYTISRVATLSRSLDLFFSGYLNTLFSKEEYKGKIYTLYAGGDDLFIVAPWETALRVMKDVRENFGHFTCNNPSFGLSCGVFLTGGNYPVRLAYEGVKKAEDKAKKSKGKDSICALEEVLKWEELDKAMSEAGHVIEQIGKGELGRTNFYRIYLLLREYRELEKEKDDRRFIFYPFFYYYLSRNVKENHRKSLEELILNTKDDHKVRERALFLAKYILMRTRNVRSD